MRSPDWRTSTPTRSIPARRFWLTVVRCWSVSNSPRLDRAIVSVAPAIVLATSSATISSVSVNPSVQPREHGFQGVYRGSTEVHLHDDVPAGLVAVGRNLAEVRDDLVAVLADL